MKRRDSVAPQLFHLLNRFFKKEKYGNEFEQKVFSELAKFSKKELEALMAGIEAYEKIDNTNRQNLFKSDFLDWKIEQPVDPDILYWEMLDEGMSLAGKTGIMNICQKGKVRPWPQDFNLIDAFETITAPWPWINQVNSLRTSSHRQPLPFYKPEEYQQTCDWQVNDSTGQTQATCQKARDPMCEVSQHRDNNDLSCLRVPEARAGSSVTLVGFNFFSCNCQVIITRVENGILSSSFEFDGYVLGDTSTPLKDGSGNIIADHRVTDTLMFDIPEKTPDGLIEFPPGIYQIVVKVPNDVSYTYPDGNQPSDFSSNIAYLKILPKANLGYRIWSDQAHCYNDTDGEVGSDEIFIKAYPAIFDPNTQAPQILDPVSARWDGADGGNTQFWNWEILGRPGSPQIINGMLGIGIIGWEVDSEDALSEAITSYDAAFTKFWNIVWVGITSVAGGTLVAGVILAIIGKLAWWVGLIVVAAVLLVTLIVGLIWAAWAPPDRMILDLIALNELDLYYLTYPLSPVPAASAHALIPDINVKVLPDPYGKYATLYTEERQYDCHSEDSVYGIRFLYQRDI